MSAVVFVLRTPRGWREGQREQGGTSERVMAKGMALQEGSRDTGGRGGGLKDGWVLIRQRNRQDRPGRGHSPAPVVPW